MDLRGMTTSIVLSNSYPVDHMQFIRSKDMSVNNLKSLYYSLIHSTLTYDTMLWGSSYQYRLHKLEILQKKSIRNMCNAGYNARKSSVLPN